MEEAELSIKRSSKESFSQLLYDIAHRLGYAAGSLLGTIRRWLEAL